SGDLRCDRAGAKLPSQVADQRRSRTRPSSPALAAWGTDQLLWRCGVPPPAMSSRACLRVDGIDWLVTDLPDGTEFTTYGREPGAQVLVRKRPRPAEVLPDLAAAAGELTRTGECS
ncbi:MAG: DUF3515 family protein, partial [Angustibacter sp.]